MTMGSPASGVAKAAAREGAVPKGLIRKISCALCFLHRHYCELRRPRRYLSVNISVYCEENLPNL